MATPLILIKLCFFVIIVLNLVEIYELLNTHSFQPELFLHIGIILIFAELSLRLKPRFRLQDHALVRSAPQHPDALALTATPRLAYPLTLLGIAIVAASSLLTQIP